MHLLVSKINKMRYLGAPVLCFVYHIVLSFIRKYLVDLPGIQLLCHTVDTDIASPTEFKGFSSDNKPFPGTKQTNGNSEKTSQS